MRIICLNEDCVSNKMNHCFKDNILIGDDGYCKDEKIDTSDQDMKNIVDDIINVQKQERDKSEEYKNDDI